MSAFVYSSVCYEVAFLPLLLHRFSFEFQEFQFFQAWIIKKLLLTTAKPGTHHPLMFQLIVFLMGIFAAQSIEFTTYASRTDCNDPWKTTSRTIIASNACTAGTGKYGSSRWTCFEKKIMLTTFTNSPDCGLTPNNETVVTATEIAVMDKCIQLGRSWLFYDCSEATTRTRSVYFFSAVALSMVALLSL